MKATIAAAVLTCLFSPTVFGGAPQAVPVPNKPSPTQPPSPTTTTIPEEPSEPPKDSVRWYQERALVFFAQERPAYAAVELYRAQDRIERDRDSLKTDPKAAPRLAELNRRETEVNYFLAFLHARNGRSIDAIKLLEPIVANTETEHLPARLLLARSYADIKAWDRAVGQTQSLIRLLAVKDDRVGGGLKKIKAWIAVKPSAARDTELNRAVKDLLDAADGALLDSPVTYREQTLGRKVRDPLVYMEVVRLFADADDPDEARGMMEEAIRVRNGFFPVGLMGLGEIEETAAIAAEEGKAWTVAADRYAAALADYERTLDQLRKLEFPLDKGDFAPERLDQLRQKITALRAQATPPTKP